jgi:hypothetical protein
MSLFPLLVRPTTIFHNRLQAEGLSKPSPTPMSKPSPTLPDSPCLPAHAESRRFHWRSPAANPMVPRVPSHEPRGNVGYARLWLVVQRVLACLFSRNLGQSCALAPAFYVYP